MLYDSEFFVVLQLHANASAPFASLLAPKELPRMGFEIIDKRSGKEVYLDGSWAELFQQHLNDWQEKMPTPEEIETTIEGYAALAHTTLSLH